ncbi:MAG: hypothetical protein KDK34_21345, partial [Leptospiraceae bacterium]|nr:hypothetical protein [Leptospiraceae bacterium]
YRPAIFRTDHRRKVNFSYHVAPNIPCYRLREANAALQASPYGSSFVNSRSHCAIYIPNGSGVTCGMQGMNSILILIQSGRIRSVGNRSTGKKHSYSRGRR